MRFRGMQNLELDVWYVDNRTIWLDLKIIWLTFRKVVKREGIWAGSYDVEVHGKQVVTLLIGVHGALAVEEWIMPLLREQYADADFVFIDDGKAPNQVNGHKIISWIDFIERPKQMKRLFHRDSQFKIRQHIAENAVAAVPLIGKPGHLQLSKWMT